MPLVTILIPTYNRSEMLRRAIQSALNQTCGDFIVRVFDNCSTDDTEAVVREMMADKRVEYVRQPRNVGMIENFRTALTTVKTDYFVVSCDDDTFTPFFLDSALAWFVREPMAGAVCGSVVQTYNGKIVGVPMDRSIQHAGLYGVPDALRIVARDICIGVQGMLIRREVIDKVGNFTTECGTQFDKDYYYRILSQYPVVLTREPYAVSDRHDGTCTSEGAIVNIDPALADVVRHFEASPTPQFIKDEIAPIMWQNFYNQLRYNGELAAVNGRWQTHGEAVRSFLNHGKVWHAIRMFLIGAAFCYLRPVALALLWLRRKVSRDSREKRYLNEKYGRWSGVQR